MPVWIAILGVLALGIGIVVKVTLLTIKKVKELIGRHLEKKKKSEVAFGSMRKIVNEHAEEILSNAASMKMSDLEEIAEETPYFIVDYDTETGEVSNFTSIQAEKVEEKVEELFYENDGIVLFNY